METPTSIIRLLPEYVANQIAAGEVVQRPSNIVKELLENSIDAGATAIRLLVHHGGKTLIEVADNGCGISPLDARMAFERHATSKISSVEDLQRLHTMGFRGEALASIAAVAKVEMLTRQEHQTTATHLVVDKNEVVSQTQSTREVGTTMTVKNLFFHIPARKHFLKSDITELRYVITEFIRIALAYPEVAFTLFHHQETLYQLPQGSLKQRIVQIHGKSYEEKIIGIKEATDHFSIDGYIGKPLLANKETNKRCFLIVNRRFVHCPLIHRAIVNAYGNLIGKDDKPFYVLHLDLDPQTIDINVHPSKQEIKFSDERWIFAFVQSHVKYALAKNNLDYSPLQFDLDQDVQSLPIIQTAKSEKPLEASQLSSAFRQSGKAHYIEVDWKKEMTNLVPQVPVHPSPSFSSTEDKCSIPLAPYSPAPPMLHLDPTSAFHVFQFLKGFLIVEQNDHCLLIDQQAAHERMLFHHISERLSTEDTSVGKTLLTEPLVFSVSPSGLLCLQEHASTLQHLGFQLEQVGLSDIAVYGFPSFLETEEVESSLLAYLDDAEHYSLSPHAPRVQQLAESWAKKQAFKRNRLLSKEEQQQFVQALFRIPQHSFAPDGTPVLKKLEKKEVLKWMRSL